MTTFLLIILNVFQLQASSGSEQKKVSLESKKATLKEILKEVEKQSNYTFFYNPKDVDVKTEISISVKDVPVNEALAIIFEKTSIGFEISGKQILLFDKRKAHTQASEDSEKNETKIIEKTINGYVVDETNGPLPGVNILEKGTTNGTTTDANGRFTLEVADEGSIIIFSFIGYLTSEVVVGTQTQFTVNLQPDIQSLEEVVVVGYGAVRKSDITGSVSSISEEEIKRAPVTSLAQTLQGRAAGVQVTQTSHQPGGGVTIRIRGGNSIQGGNEPLYVIDGFPVYNESGPLLNPNDIASIEILKDASATAIYGSRGANGVVLITTKRGKSGQSNINFESYYGIQQVRKKLPLLNATQFAQLVNEANINEGRQPVYSAEEITAFGEGTDWQEEVFRDAPIQNYQLSLAGGDEKTQYAISGNYFRQDGIIVNSDFNRASFRINLDRKISNKLKIGNNLSLSRTMTNEVLTGTGETTNAGVIYAAIGFPPTLPVYNPDGSYLFQNDRGAIMGNPVAIAREITNEYIRFRVLGNFFAEYQLLEGLTARVSVGTNVQMNESNFYAPRTTLRGVGQGGVGNVGASRTLEWLNENTLTYNKTIDGKHALTILAGYTMQGAEFKNVIASAQQFSNDVLTYNDLGSGALANFPNTDVFDWGLSSFLGRVNYSYQDKYLLTLTARADGSSRFGEGNKYGFFPSGSVAWRISQEPFMQNQLLFSDLKIRTSFGVTGNQEIGQYLSLAALTSAGYVFNNNKVIGYRISRIANPDLKWETTNQFDVGLDAGFFQNRLTLTADYYYKVTNDLLLNVTLPWTSGYASALQNLGSVQNQGVELALNSDNLVGKLKWTTNLNFSANRNKVLDLGEVDQFFSGQGQGKIVNSGIVRVGESLNSFFGLVADGIFQQGDDIASSAQPGAKPGDIRYKDIIGDGLLNNDDRTIIGNAQPEFIGGITNNFSYKGFELSIFLQGSYGNDIFNMNRLRLEDMSGANNNSIDVLNRWTTTNPSNEYPRARAAAAGGDAILSSRLIEDGSFLRARNISFGYDFSQSLLKATKLRSAKLYISTQNLFTLTNYSGYDPEVSVFGQDNLSLGSDVGTYPSTKTYMIGLNIGL